ncbi:transmembrane protein 52 isoform X2 [Bombina bombina]|uniref:transmembrane protein 52 isoform X2 n=1 Tax=Bombina bombina TaxID=8345 RepID=UPI00235A6418|nr:transmembrane protein 52 isoform X2 [Bombina bombina]
MKVSRDHTYGIYLLVCCMQMMISLSLADDDCGKNDCSQSTNWVNLWYVWLILVTIFLLLLCGTTASCIKFCCKKKKPPVQEFPSHPYEVTVIAIDNDTYSSVQYPHMFAFPDPDRSTISPPAYSLYAMELPPAYEEAIKMSKPNGGDGTSVAGPKLENITEQDCPEEEEDRPVEQQPISNDAESPPHYEETETIQGEI